MGATIWTRKKQHALSMSLIEIEYCDVVKGACEEVWIKRMLLDMKMPQREPTSLLCGYRGMLKLAKNLVFHEHTKHVEIQFSRLLV
jgi:hypothetical protein